MSCRDLLWNLDLRQREPKNEAQKTKEEPTKRRNLCKTSHVW
jgi:hypothetical protein